MAQQLRQSRTDAPEKEKAKYMESYQKAMDTSGFTSDDVIIKRAIKVNALIPEIMEVAELVIENNPNIAE